MKSFLRFLAILATIYLTGCSLVPSDHKTAGELGAEHSVNVTKQLDNTPPPVTIKASGWGKVDYKAEPTKSAVTVIEGDKQVSKASSFSSLPLGYKIILIALGLGLLLAVGVIFLHYSPAAKAGWDAANMTLANLIHHKTSQAMITTDPEKLSVINADIAALHNERAKLP